MSKYGVLSERELEARLEVAEEQYVTKLNIEAETTVMIARTMILPAAVRYLNELIASGREGLIDEFAPLVGELHGEILALEQANEDPGMEGIELAKYMHGTVFPAMEAVRAVADKLEKLVADDLWPLPKYSEMLFIK
jgi:glutamine synthetase